MVKNKLRGIACGLAVSFSVLLIPNINAYASDRINLNNTRKAIEETTKMKDVNNKLTSSKEFVAISDGENSLIQVPKNPNEPIKVKSADNNNENFSINLPKEAKNSNVTKTDNGTILYTKKGSLNSFGTQILSSNEMEGIRSLITINTPNASKEYEFKFNLKKGSRLVSDSDYLGKDFSSGEIFIVDKDNIITGIIEKPWAYDANKKPVATHYKIVGSNKLIQVVDFKSTNAFPITADPSAWQITKCVGSIAWAIGSGIFAWSKLLKIKKYIAALGGLRNAAALLVGATTWSEKMKAGGTALLNLAAEISGISGIKDNCFP